MTSGILARFFCLYFIFSFSLEVNSKPNQFRFVIDHNEPITKTSKNGFVIIPPHPVAKVTLGPSKQFSLTANGLPVAVRNASKANDAWFFFAGEVEIEVKFHEKINSYEISPKSLPAEIIVRGDIISIKINSPRKFIIYNVNGKSESMAVFADSPPENVPDIHSKNVIDVSSYISKEKLVKISDAERHEQLIDLDVSNEIQNAINDLKKDAVLFFPAGLYPVSSVKIKSEMELYLAPGSILYAICGTPKINGENKPMLDVPNVTNTSIRGHGTIMANGQIFSGGGDKTMRRQVSLRMNGTNLIFSDFLIREQQHWPWLLGQSENVLIRNIKILTSRDGDNRDGIGISTTKNILIEDNFVCSGDDALVIKADTNVENFDYQLIARNNVLWNMCSGGGIKIGTQFWHPGVRNLRFENNDIISAPRSISFYFSNNDQNVSDVIFKNTRCEKTKARPEAQELLMDLKLGSIQNLKFINLYAMHNSPIDLSTEKNIDVIFNGLYRYPNGIEKECKKILSPEPLMRSDGVHFTDIPTTIIGIRTLIPAVNKPGVYGVFKVSRSGDLSSSLSIPYSMRTTSIPGKDFVALNGIAILKEGAAETIINVEFLKSAFKGNNKSLLVIPDYISDDYVMMGTDFQACVAILAKP